MNRKGIGAHHNKQNIKDEWLTPPEIINALGPFDLDPCVPIDRPWDTAYHHYTIEQPGLMQIWKGRIWLNAPYGSQTGVWLQKLSEHGQGTALVFARTDTNFFFDYIWTKADALLFIKGRLYFYHVDGTRAKYDSGAPSVLVAYGPKDKEILRNCSIKGAFIDLRK